MNGRRLVALVCALGTTMTPLAARAQVTSYTTLAAYLAALTYTATDTFDDLSLQYFTSPIDRTVTPYRYSASAPGGLFGANGTATPALSTNTATDPLTFDTFSNTVLGVGGFFFATNYDGNVVPGTIRVDWTVVGSAAGFETIVNATTHSFFGVVSADGAISSFVLTAQQQGDPNIFVFPTADNLTLGTVVPEPASFALVAAGLLGLGVFARRRRIVA
jgi:hypothetical protein